MFLGRLLEAYLPASLSAAPWHSLTTACWYMCVSGKSLSALVARDKTRSAQSSRSSSGVWWCLDGKASEYYALLVERNQEMGYMDLIRKLEKRFGFRELPETAQV
jgi:hypothetical protein